MRDFEENLKIGRENQRILELAKSWCAHIRPSRGMMGVGLLEQQTGLPISGGTFRCDHAKIPAMHGMRLDSIALEFYANNCRGCEHRAPVGPLLEHLGSWADAHLKKREDQAQESRRLAQEASAARQARHDARNLRLKGINAQTDAIVDLVNQLDADHKSSTAGRDLQALAKLAPEGFNDRVAAELRDSARTLHSSEILDALVLSQDPACLLDSETHNLACAAVCDHWSSQLTFDYVAAHASTEDLRTFPTLLRAAIWKATADQSVLFEHPPPQPDLLLRLFQQAPEVVREGLLQGLAQAEPWPASRAARASFFIIQADTATIKWLLDPLFRVLMRPGRDDEVYGGRPKPVSNAVRSLSLALCCDTAHVDKALRERWATSDTLSRAALLQVYERAVRRRLKDQPSVAVPSMAANLAVETLISASTNDLLRGAGDLLHAACEASTTSVSTDTLLGVISVLGGRLDELTSILNQPQRGAELEREAAVLTTQICLRHAVAATAAAARQDPSAFWAPCYSVFAGSDPRSQTRTALLQLAGAVGCSFHEMGAALPMVYTGMFGNHHAQRSQAIEAVGNMDWAEVAVAPEAMVQGVLAGLQDQYVAVLSAACGTIVKIPTNATEKITAIRQLLLIAHTLAPKRSIAESAIESSLTLARGTKFAPAVAAMCLTAIEDMPPYNAVEALCRFPELQGDKSWPRIAVHALRPDPDPEYADLGREERRRLLADVGRLPAEVVSTHADALVALAGGESLWWSLAVADVLSRGGLHGRAAQVARDAAQAIKDTTEKRVPRLMALKSVAAFTVEEKLAEGDPDAAAVCLAEWKTLEQRELEAREEANRAQRPFFPPVL